MLRSVSAAAARTARRLDLQSIQRQSMLLRPQISTVQIPFATPPTTHCQSNLFSSRAYPRMARRIPPTRPDNYSDSEPDKEEQDEEMDVSDEEDDLDPEPWRKWGGMTLYIGSDKDSDPEEDEEENK